MVHVKKKRLKLRERKPLAQGHTDELKSKAGLEYKSLSSETDALDLFRFRFTLFKLNKIRDCFQIGKGVRQGCILLPCLFNLYAEYIMRNAGLDEAQAGIKIAGRNINNLRYANDTTLMAESEEELKSFLMKVKEESEKVVLKFNIQKTKITASSPIT